MTGRYVYRVRWSGWWYKAGTAPRSRMFSRESDAQNARRKLEDKGFDVEVLRAEVGRWEVVS